LISVIQQFPHLLVDLLRSRSAAVAGTSLALCVGNARLIPEGHNANQLPPFTKKPPRGKTFRTQFYALPKRASDFAIAFRRTEPAGRRATYTGNRARPSDRHSERVERSATISQRFAKRPYNYMLENPGPEGLAQIF